MKVKSKRNKVTMRVLAFMLAFIMTFTGLPLVNFGKVETKAAKSWGTNQEISDFIGSLKSKYHGRYWNANKNVTRDVSSVAKDALTDSPCVSSSRGSGCKSNDCDSTYQCSGFARWFGYYLFGTDPYNEWQKFTDFSNAKLEPGDIIRVYGSTGLHSAVIWKIDETTDQVYVAQCLGSNCEITWGAFNRHTKNCDTDFSSSTLTYIKENIKHWYKHPGGTVGGGYADTSNTVSSKASNIYASNPIVPTGNLNLGQKFGIRGKIYSTYKLTNVTGSILTSDGAVKQQKSVNPGKTQYDLSGAINNAMIFNNLSSGSYTFVVTATDSKGYTKEVIRQGFSVGTIPQPSISTSNYYGGVNVNMSASKGAIYYTTDGSEPSASSRRYTGTISLTSSALVKAVAIENGTKSSTVSTFVTVGALSTPVINSSIGESAVTVNITADAGTAVYYTLDGTEPTMGSTPYYGAFQMKDGATVKAKAFRSGSTNSGTGTANISITTPNTPSVSIVGNSKIATGDAVKITWDKQASAYSYTAKLYQGSTLIKEQSTTGTGCAFTLPNAGEYTITVKAGNFKGSSEESYPPVTVTAMEPSTVTFVDYDGSVIASQMVKYGYYAELPAENPSRRGYDFKRWDNNAVYQPVKSELTVTAQYSKKKYIVKFIDEDGSSLAAQQEVLFEESVVLPEDPTTDKVGYAFMGWRCVSTDESSALDYEHVDANMTLQAVYDWGNRDHPIVTQITKANQEDSNSYKVSVKLTNWPDAKSYARMLVTLKTSEGKMVKTITQDVTLEADATTTINDIEIISDKVATKVEINMVGLDGEKTGGTYADSVTSSTTSYANTMWSEWSTSAPPSGATYETKTQYRYRDRYETTSTASSLAGWTQYGTPTTSYGGWGGTCSTTAYPGTSDTLQITGSSTVYHYYHVCCNKYGSPAKNYVDSIVCGSGSHYWHFLDTTSPLPTLSMQDQGGRQAYGGKGKASGCSAGFYAWFDNGQTTTYYYQTRSKTVTYYYYTWGGYSGWSDTAVSSGSNRQVETRQCYRYLINLETPTDGEDNSGKTYTQEGTISSDVDMNGKKAAVLVYKSTNSDPTENQLEYVGQTTIGEGNSYSFAFKPKESPDEANSNFIIALAIEGQTSIYNIDVMNKTRPKYTVSFYNKDGELISDCQVEENMSAEVPEAPIVEGYTFVGWDKDTTNVQADRVITAVYKANEYSIVYVDWETNKIDMMQLSYGTDLPNVEVEEVEGKEFLGWDKLLDGKTTVDDHMIIEAKYEIQQFVVQFVDEEGNVISEQDVEYGESAQLPGMIDVGEKEFLGWSNQEPWWNVTRNMIVEPIVVYKETVLAPTYSVEDTYIGGIVTLTSENAENIYYKVDVASEYETEGTVSENSVSQSEESDWLVYEDDILLDEDATVYFYAEASDKNTSEAVEMDYTFVEVENPYLTTAEIIVPKIYAKAGEEITIPVQLSKNPGLMGILLDISFDTNSFSNVSVEVGDVFAEGIFDYGLYEDTGELYVIWASTENTYETGAMFIIKMTANEDMTEGAYPITMLYNQDDTFNDNWDDVLVTLPQLAVNIGDIVYGDVNEDGNINNKDVAFVACYLVGKEALTDSGERAADVNCDEKVDNKDVAKLARYLVGKETAIGVK